MAQASVLLSHPCIKDSDIAKTCVSQTARQSEPFIELWNVLHRSLSDDIRDSGDIRWHSDGVCPIISYASRSAPARLSQNRHVIMYHIFPFLNSLCSVYSRPPDRLFHDRSASCRNRINAWGYQADDADRSWPSLYETSKGSGNRAFWVSPNHRCSHSFLPPTYVSNLGPEVATVAILCHSHYMNHRVSALLPQLIVVGLTVIKFFAGLRAGWGKIPIVSMLVRDDIILVTFIGEFLPLQNLTAPASILTDMDSRFSYNLLFTLCNLSGTHFIACFYTPYS